MDMVKNQVALGPRVPGSESHANAVNLIVAELEKNGWKTEIQDAYSMGHPVRNVIGKWGDDYPLVIIGAHYDTRIISERDPIVEFRSTPGPGANDGASGVAVLLELGRVIPQHFPPSPIDNSDEDEQPVKQIWLVFFDAEDNGNIAGWDWILGSRVFVESLTEKPSAAIILDLIGDSNLKIYQEENSNPGIIEEIWEIGKNLGYSDAFIPMDKYRILDDHIPFLEVGIPAVDIIDFEYPYRHTTQDTPDKVSPESLQVVGDTILAWLIDASFKEE